MGFGDLRKIDYITRMITLIVITLSGLHCTRLKDCLLFCIKLKKTRHTWAGFKTE